MTDMDDNGITTRDIELICLPRSSDVQDQVVSSDTIYAREETDTKESSTRDIDAHDEIVKEELSIPDIDAHGITVKWKSSTRDIDARGDTVKRESSTRDIDARCETVKGESSTRDIDTRDDTVKGESSTQDKEARVETFKGKSSTRYIDTSGETVKMESSKRDIDARGKTGTGGSSTQDICAHGETVRNESLTQAIDQRVSKEPEIDEPSSQCQTAQRTYGCMVCKKKTKLHTFNANSLERGDHIQINGRLPFIGRAYNHHAIISDVRNITEDGKHARVRVVDVSEKAREGCHRKNIIACNHKLNEMEQVKCSKLVRLDYRKRRHDKENTFKRSKNSSFSVKYCCLMRNCEHFATGCVGGEHVINDQGINNSTSLQATGCVSGEHIMNDQGINNSTSLQATGCVGGEHIMNDQGINNSTSLQATGCVGGEHIMNDQGIHNSTSSHATGCVSGEHIMNDREINNSTSLQVTACFWRILNCFLQILQLFIYIFNFYIYAVFAAENENHNHFPDGLSHWLKKTCQNQGNVFRGFDTICDWVILAICVLVYSGVFGILFLWLFCCKYKMNYMCSQCLLSTGCVFVFRVVVFVVFDIINIFTEKWLYDISLCVNISGTIVIIVIIAIVEGIVIYVLAHYITKSILWCSGQSCCLQTCSKCCCVVVEEDSYKYTMYHL